MRTIKAVMMPHIYKKKTRSGVVYFNQLLGRTLKLVQLLLSYRQHPRSYHHLCHPQPFLQYSPFTESCIQLALGVFQILKAPFLHCLSKYTLSNSLAKFIALTLSFTFLYVHKYHLCLSVPFGIRGIFRPTPLPNSTKVLFT